MADIIDRANDYHESWLQEQIRKHGVATIPKGEPGECDWCGQFNPRIVKGACSKCRDKLKLC